MSRTEPRAPLKPLLFNNVVFAMAVFGLALLAAACSTDPASDAVGEITVPDGNGQSSPDQGGDDDISPAAPDAEADAEGETAGEGDPSADDEPEPTTVIGKLEQQWAEARADVVDRIEQGGYGVNADNVLIGPSGYRIDLSQCPTDWRDNTGLGDSIVIGHTTSQSGELWAYSNLAVGMEAYFDYVNDTGGVGGRQLELVVKDDWYDRTRTVNAVDELLEQDDPFLITTLGSPTSLAVRDRLNEACVPHPFVMSSHPAWADPMVHPWSTGMEMSLSTEAILWGRWLERELADDLPLTVSALVVDNELGHIYEAAFAQWADANPDVIARFTPVRHDWTARQVAGEMATIAATEPDVYISMSEGAGCFSAMLEGEALGLSQTAKALITSSVCRGTEQFMTPAGTAAEGFHSLSGGRKPTTDPRYVDDPYIAWANQVMADAGLETSIGFYGSGFSYYGWAHVEALRIAAELEGGLTRTNLMLAQRAMDLTHPVLLDGIRFAADGAVDGYFIEGSEMSRYDAAQDQWIQVGEVIDVNGASPTCSWDGASC